MSGRTLQLFQHDNPHCKAKCVWPMRCAEKEKVDRAAREAEERAGKRPTPGMRFELVEDDDEGRRQR